MQIGYFGLIVPAAKYSKAHPLTDVHMAMADRMIEMSYKLSDTRYQPPVATIRALDGVSQRDQDAVGAISSTLVEMAMIKSWEGLSAAALAVSRLIKCNYFLVEGNRQFSGTRTHIEPLRRATSKEDITKALDLHAGEALVRDFFDQLLRST